MDEEEFYSKINRSLFDAGIELMSNKVLADIVRLLVMCDIGGRSFHNTRPLVTYASMKLTEQMVADMKDSFGDVDKFLATGRLPDYMQDIPPNIRHLMEEAARKLRDSRGI